MKKIIYFLLGFKYFLCIYFLMQLISCKPDTPVDPRTVFVGNWCWTDTQSCGGVPYAVYQIPSSIALSNVANQVIIDQTKTGIVSGNTITIEQYTDSFGGTWTGTLELSGSGLSYYYSIYYAATGETCTEVGPAIRNNNCQLMTISGGTGQVIFWTSTDHGCGDITVSVGGQTGVISEYYSSGAPACGSNGCATFTLASGSYSFSASCTDLTWNSTITVSASGCWKEQLY